MTVKLIYHSRELSCLHDKSVARVAKIKSKEKQMETANVLARINGIPLHGCVTVHCHLLQVITGSRQETNCLSPSLSQGDTSAPFLFPQWR